MKLNNIKYTLAAGFVAVAAMSLSAQDTYSGYFLDNYTYRYQMNPAMGNRSAFVSMPVLGNMNIGLAGNLHTTSLFRNITVDGQKKTVLFTHPGVSDPMSGFKDVNRLGFNTKLNILSGGFKAWGGYNTISINAHAGMDFHLPKSLFSVLAEGISNTTYNIDDIRARALGYAEIMLGHSRDIPQVPGLRAGINMKFLLGLGYAQMDMNHTKMVLGEDAWRINSDGFMRMSLGDAKFKYDSDGNWDGIDMNGFSLNGFGVAFDLGATYEWNDFTFSLAFNDLGFINYKNAQVARADAEFTTDDYIFNVNDMDPTLDNLTDDLKEIFRFREDKSESFNHTLGAVMNVGVDYKLPYYRRLHFGLLNHTVFAGPYTTTEFRLSANVAPVDIFSANVNLVAGTYGFGFGWMLNLNLRKGFNLYLGMDRIPGKVSKQFIPLNSNMSFNFGMNFPF